MNPSYIDKFEQEGLMFVGRDVDNERMEVAELEGIVVFMWIINCINLQQKVLFFVEKVSWFNQVVV